MAMRGRMILTAVCAAVLAVSPCAASDSGAADSSNATAEGSTLQIFSSDSIVKDLVTAHLSGYKATDDTHGIVTDVDGRSVTVVWNFLDDSGAAYQEQIDGQLYSNGGYLPDDRIDLFTASTGYLRKYTGRDSDVAIPLGELGITDDDLSSQFDYTKKVASDEDGKVRAAAIEANVGLMFYNRSVAKAVYGTDDPGTIASKAADLASLKQMAGDLAAGGSHLAMTASDLYPVYAAHRGTAWLKDDGTTVQVDDALKQWADDCRSFRESGQLTTDDQGSDAWKSGFQPDSGCFAYFEPLHTIESSVANGWAACAGPAAFTDGDLYLLAARGSDNPTLDARIIRLLTTDEATMNDAEGKGLDVNNTTVLRALSSAGNAGVSALDGQNPYDFLVSSGNAVDVSKVTSYDEKLDSLFRNAMEDYINGRITYEEALDHFGTNVKNQFENLKTA